MGYADAGATMSDSLDGVCVTHNNNDKDDNDPVCNLNNAYGTTSISGDTVDVFNNYFEKSSCEAIKTALPNAVNGRYVISPVDKDHRQIVNCFFSGTPCSSSKNGACAFTFRIFHHTNVANCVDELGAGAKLLQDAIDDQDIDESVATNAIHQTTKYSLAQVQEIIRSSSSSSTLHDHEFACTQFGTPTHRQDLSVLYDNNIKATD